MADRFRSRILSRLSGSGRRPLQYRALLSKCCERRTDKRGFNSALDSLLADGTVVKTADGFMLASQAGVFGAVVTRINRTFGFIKRNDDMTEVFIPGKFLLGALPGDEVTARLIPSRTGSPEGEILRIIRENDAKFTGVAVMEDGILCIKPDNLTKNPIPLVKGGCEFSIGDKISARIVSRGERHSDHRAIAEASFGSSGRAVSCALAVLDLNGIRTEFPEEVLREAAEIGARGIDESELAGRLDLRGECIFTIDGADTKDIDDAISLEKTADGWYLGVHIADVSHYVRPRSELDKEAFARGTSVYYANKVIPMLPKELSNGICSLNPGEDRLAFSALMRLGADGRLISYEFKKTVIRSRVKGVYSEINDILADRAGEEILAKYSGLTDKIFLMRELAAVLTENKVKRGAPQLETTESKLIIDENDVCVDVRARSRGESELFIEEFMLMANEAAARLAKENELPFVYRVHESPSPEKVADLCAVLPKLGIIPPDFKEIKPYHMARILESAKDSRYFMAVNNLVLRSMAKAKYSETPLGHFGLVLKDYAHFTSPIRRYPDLAIHRIMTEFLQSPEKGALKRRYTAFAVAAAARSTETEIAAMTAERSCDDCYKAEYMTSFIGKRFEGIISSVTEFGFYVELPNTVEGLVHIRNLTDGSYFYDGEFSIIGGEHRYSVGDSVTVEVTGADVNSGNVDFIIPAM